MGQFNSIRFLPGRPLTQELGSERLNAIVTEIKRNKPKGERGITVRQDGTGTYIGLAASLPRGGTPATRLPWDIYVKEFEGDEDNRTYTLKVHPGTLSNILPYNWDDEFSVGDDLVYGIATISTDGKNITELSIDISTDSPTQQTPQKFGIESSVEYLFGLFKSGQSYNVLQESISLFPRLHIVTSPDPAAEPGESPFDLYYQLAP